MNGTLVEIPTGELHHNTTEVRLDRDDRDTLTASIAAVGILEPLIATPDPDGGYIIIAGRRRHASAQDAGLATVPCLVREGTDAATEAMMMLHENVARDDLSEAEIAKGIQQILDLGGNIKTIAKGLHLDTKQVKAYVTVASASEATRTALHQRQLTLDEALTLTEFEDHPDIHAHVLDRLSRGDNSRWVLDNARRAVATQVATAKAEAHAAEVGLPIVANDYRHRVLDEAAQGEHNEAPCHAVQVASDCEDGYQHVCTDPARHQPAATKTDDDGEREAQRVARRRVINNNKTWATVTEIRQAWIKEFLNRKTPPKGALVPLVRLLAHRSPESTSYVDALRRDNPEVSAWGHFGDRTASITTDARATRVLLLTVVRDIEAQADRESWRHSHEDFAYYLATLGEWGYTLTPPEALYAQTVNNGGDPAEVDYVSADTD